jgi:hypothetical protein
MFDPARPAALRRWIRAHAVSSVPDLDLLNALVLVVNEAVTLGGDGTPVTVELWRGPEELRFLVTSTAVLPALSRTVLPDDPRMRALWLTMQVNPAVRVVVTDDRITVTIPARRWS